MIRPRNQTEDLLLSITKICETLIKQTHWKPRETLEYNVTKPKETLSFNPSINLGLDSKWIIGLTSLEVYNSLSNITEENHKFQLYTDTFDEFSYAQLKDSVAETLVFQIFHSRIYNMKYKNQILSKLATEKSQTDGYMILFMGYARFSFRDFETYLRIVVGFDERTYSIDFKTL